MFKRIMFLSVGLISGLHAQDLVVPQSNKSATPQEKLSKLNKAVEYLKGKRDCLSGIGCSKKDSYFANYTLGAAFGLAKGLISLPAMAFSKEKGKISLAMAIALSDKLAFIIADVGYRQVVKNEVSLSKCLTFRGCSDQTKRYMFYHLGQLSGDVLSLVTFSTMYGIYLQNKSNPL